MLQQTIQNALAVLAISCLANVDNWLPGRIGYSEKEVNASLFQISPGLALVKAGTWNPVGNAYPVRQCALDHAIGVSVH
jgi:hypothetical protein